MYTIKFTLNGQDIVLNYNVANKEYSVTQVMDIFKMLTDDKTITSVTLEFNR